MINVVRNILIVGTGSFLGGASRYMVSLLLKNFGKGFPWATIAANLLGCFLIGMLWAYFSRDVNGSGNWALFLMAGFCGGFTTFSTFSKEALMMLQTGNFWSFAGYVALSVLAGIALVALGYRLVR
ncbi:MAG: fluoride efflux transporter CrcB [Candidatus Cryptobacteroides sp.]